MQRPTVKHTAARIAGPFAALLTLFAFPPHPASAAPPTPAAHAAPTHRPPQIDPDGDGDGDDVKADDPKNQARFNKELWESIKHTPYSDALRYVARVQERERTRLAAKPDADAVTLPTGWKIAPAGQSIPVGRLPYEAVAFAGKIVVLNDGYYAGKDQPEVSVVDPASRSVVKTLHFPALFPSARVGLDGDLYISGGFTRQIYRVDRNLEIKKTYTLGSGYAGAIAPLDATHVAFSYLVASDTEDDYSKGRYGVGHLAILNTATGAISQDRPCGYFPYALTLANGKLYAGLLGESRVLIYDKTLQPIGELQTGTAPESFAVDGDRLYVVNANSDNVSVVDTTNDLVDSTIELNAAGTHFGGAPTSCAVGPDRLYITLANINSIAVVDKGSLRTIGYIPTGWYPTRALVDSKTLYFLSAKGVRTRRPNPRAPEPAEGTFDREQYVLTLLKGTLSEVPLAGISAHLSAWTRQVDQGSPLFSPASGFKLPIHHVFYIVRENRTYDQIMGDLPRANGDPKLTLFGREVTPNAHALAQQFVTLDNYFTDAEVSVLGHSITTSGYASPFLEWMANASYSGRYRSYPYGSVPAVTSPEYLWDALDARHVDYRIYGENYYLYTRGRALIQAEFGPASDLAQTFDAQMMVIANNTDRGRSFYDFANTYYARMTSIDAAYALLGDADFSNKLSEYLCGNDALAAAFAARPELRRQFAEFLWRYPANYRSWDLSYSDIDRYQAWKTDFDTQVAAGKVAQLSYLWLPNDHTAGAGTKPLAPDQLVAENDAALARIVQTIAASPIWKDSLILVTEDDAQDGPDHVDATRTVGLAIGPYVKRGAVISDRYDQLSLLRTIELILGLDPMNRNDALAAPMFGIFRSTPDLTPPAAPVASAHLSDRDTSKFQAE